MRLHALHTLHYQECDPAILSCWLVHPFTHCPQVETLASQAGVPQVATALESAGGAVGDLDVNGRQGGAICAGKCSGLGARVWRLSRVWCGKPVAVLCPIPPAPPCPALPRSLPAAQHHRFHLCVRPVRKHQGIHVSRPDGEPCHSPCCSAAAATGEARCVFAQAAFAQLCLHTHAASPNLLAAAAAA